MAANATTICPSCGTGNDATDRFCAECGTPLTRACTSCGASLRPGAKFCHECGTAIGEGAAGDTAGGQPLEPGARSPERADAGPLPTERRLVTVLFVDLVDFTGLAERADPEAVRETLDRYFERASGVIRQYGGVVEKFIGDAVVAVWGAPTAHEDDAERAVRAALELVDVVHALALAAPDAPRLSIRAGVTTGEAAVTVGAIGQGMVTGDIVNTASRLQSGAEPDTVLVGEGTYRATHGSVAYEPQGELTVKGKAAGVRAWHALRVIAQRRGAGRSGQLEAPFVGREEELRLLKDTLEATGREGRARLVSVVGQGGIGKSRLAWEFLKFVDGLVENVYWHQGRSLAYGTGISYWALGEMVRARAGIGEGEDAAAAAAKLTAMTSEFLPDPEERAWIEPRLAALLGLARTPEGSREDLFAAWRTLFQRIAERATTVLVFEDLQWADEALLDFIDDLLEWARSSPILVVSLARPELLERRPDWGAGRRSVSTTLDPLDRTLMTQLLAGLAPGLPSAAVDSIVARAEGVPLYAVELVRMLIADGRLEATADGYRPTGDLTSLAVPESLQALVTARLDGLDPADRALLQAAAVIGTSFTPAILAAITGQPAASLEARLRVLVRRELLTLDADPRSPTRGQYGFVQALTHDVAYKSLGRRERRALHLATAREIEAAGDEELAGILASHFLAAYRALPEGPEGEAVVTQARLALRGAAGRSAALFAWDDAQRYAEQALEITTDPADRAALSERNAEYARALGRLEHAEAQIRDAIAWHRSQDDPAGITRTAFILAGIHFDRWQIAEAVETLETAIRDRDLSEPDPELAAVVASLGRGYMALGRIDLGLEWTDRAIALAERAKARRPLVDALITRAWAVDGFGRPNEALAIARGALHLAQRWGFVEEELRERNNLAAGLESDPVLVRELIEGGIELARRHGHRAWAESLENFRLDLRFSAGEWDEALAEYDAIEAPAATTALGRARAHAFIATLRGDFPGARTWMAEVDAFSEGLTKANDLGANMTYVAMLLLAEGRFDEAWTSARNAARTPENIYAWVIGAQAAFRLRDVDRMRVAVAAVEGAVGDWYLPVATSVRGWDALLAGRWSDAITAFTAARDTYRNQRDVANTCLADVGLVAALGEDTPEGKAEADELRATLRGLHAHWLLQWLDDVVGQAAGLRAAAGTAAGPASASDVRVGSGGG